MDKLSVEILTNIFLQIHLINKIECMLVCHKWASIIGKTILLHTVHLNDEHNFNGFFRFLLQDPSRGNQVKRLVINKCFEDDFDKTELFEMLPKLQFFEIYRFLEHRYDHKDYFIRFQYDVKRLESLRCEIQHILDYECSSFAFLILTAGLCPRLTVLEVDLDYNYRSMNPLIGLLKNAPALKKLKIRSVDISMSDLEGMHINSPLLESFEIEYSSLEPNPIPDTVEPVKVMTTLLFYVSYMGIETHIAWLHYIRQKYPNLQRFRFKEHRIDDLPEEAEQRKMVDDGLIPLLKPLGSRLKSLELSSVYLEPDLFKKMDTYNSKLEHLATFCIRPRPVIQNIVLSNQYRFIKKLTLLHTPLFSLELIKQMEQLTSLELYFECFLPRRSKPIFNLHNLLESCPDSLESLRIDDAQLICDDTINYSFPIKNFTFRGFQLSEKVARFLSSCLPDLRSLFLMDCISGGSSLIFPNTNLSHLEIELEDPDYFPDLSVTTLNDNLHRYYPMEDKDQSFEFIEESFEYIDPSLYRGQRFISADKLNKKDMINIECASLQKLVINGRLAC